MQVLANLKDSWCLGLCAAVNIIKNFPIHLDVGTLIEDIEVLISLEVLKDDILCESESGLYLQFPCLPNTDCHCYYDSDGCRTSSCRKKWKQRKTRKAKVTSSHHLKVFRSPSALFFYTWGYKCISNHWHVIGLFFFLESLCSLSGVFQLQCLSYWIKVYIFFGYTSQLHEHASHVFISSNLLLQNLRLIALVIYWFSNTSWLEEPSYASWHIYVVIYLYNRLQDEFCS